MTTLSLLTLSLCAINALSAGVTYKEGDCKIIEITKDKCSDSKSEEYAFKYTLLPTNCDESNSFSDSSSQCIYDESNNGKECESYESYEIEDTRRCWIKYDNNNKCMQCNCDDCGDNTAGDCSFNNGNCDDNNNDNDNTNDKCDTEERHRKPWHALDQQERELYISAVLELKRIGKYEVFVESHADDTALHQAHSCAAFTVWHRYFLWELESQIRDLGGDYKCFALPYWDYSYETTQSFDVHEWVILNSGLGGAGDPKDNYCVIDGSFGKGKYETLHCWEGSEDSCCLTRQSCAIEDDGCCPMWSPAEIIDMIVNFPIYGLDNQQQPPETRPPVEEQIYGFSDIHEMRHGMNHDNIGGWFVPNGQQGISLGHMANLSFSPDDPVFFLLHTYVDYQWALWQDCHDYDLVSEDKITLEIYGGTLDDPKLNENQKYGPSKIDSELSYIPLRETDWSYLVRNDWTLTPRDMHNLQRWNISYETGSFFYDAKVETFCQGKINTKWFYEDGTCNNESPENNNKEFNDNTFDLLDLEHQKFSKSNKDLAHSWAKMQCKWYKSMRKDECAKCERPIYFDDCSDMEKDAKTGDIIISLNELINKTKGIECMENTRRRYWNWASQTNNLLALCRGDFDHFCDYDFIHDGKVDLCKVSKNKNNGGKGDSGNKGVRDDKSNVFVSPQINHKHEYEHYESNKLPLCDESDTIPCMINNVDDYYKLYDNNNNNFWDNLTSSQHIILDAVISLIIIGIIMVMLLLCYYSIKNALNTVNKTRKGYETVSSVEYQ
eukprot:532974_1